MSIDRDQVTDIEFARLRIDMDNLKSAVVAIKQSTEKIAESFQGLVVLQTKHEETSAGLTRAFGEIAAIKEDDKARDEKISTIQSEMPKLKLTSGWVINAVVAAVGLLLVALVMLIIKMPPNISG